MITERIKRMTPSATIELEGKISEMRQDGISVISLNAGEPDFPTPPNVVAACERAMREGRTKYTPVTGVLPLRKAICAKLQRDNNVTYAPDEIVASTGAKQALYNAVMALCGPGDEVIIPTPCWVSYVEMVKLADAVPVLVPTVPGSFALDVEAIKKAVTGATRAVIINTPNNPTGAVYSEAALRQLGELAVEHRFYIISDEVYEKLVYGGARHVCTAALSEDIRRQCVVVNGMSKAYSMTGWRLGYSASTREVARAIASLQGHTTSNSTTFVQWAGIEALENCADAVETMRQEFDRRRSAMLKRLQAMPGLTCADAQGAFYLMPDVSAYYGKRYKDTVIKDSFDFCSFMLEAARVAFVPGGAFEAPDNVRIAYSNSMENIIAGMDKVEAALALLTDN